ncbi:hypothetical protein E2C01_070916 [Portunus trituberculatus]|uniref:Uncharacterized protein n=1 Tax=Portunus trituberculatus TaxID=210409 RepID=A0A5B7HVH9_PORTR|nr:hypothetical protein [Portunus trituberculatus]
MCSNAAPPTPPGSGADGKQHSSGGLQPENLRAHAAFRLSCLAEISATTGLARNVTSYREREREAVTRWRGGVVALDGPLTPATERLVKTGASRAAPRARPGVGLCLLHSNNVNDIWLRCAKNDEVVVSSRQTFYPADPAAPPSRPACLVSTPLILQPTPSASISTPLVSASRITRSTHISS